MGASYGIGAAIAIALARRGADVAVNARHPADDVVDSIRKLDRKAVFVPGDMCIWTDVNRIVEATVEQLGRLDILVVAGKPTDRADLFLETDPDSFGDYFLGRTLSRFYAARAAGPVMRDQGRGKIVFLTSDAGRTPTPAESLIGAAGAAVVFGTRALGRELARHGIRVNTVALTLTEGTPAFEKYRRQRGSDDVMVKAFAKIEERTPFGLNKPENVADLVLFLSSDASDQITGATISINGGISFPG